MKKADKNVGKIVGETDEHNLGLDPIQSSKYFGKLFDSQSALLHVNLSPQCRSDWKERRFDKQQFTGHVEEH